MSDSNYTLDAFNHLAEYDAAIALANCCTSTNWINGMVKARPFLSIAACQEFARELWAVLSEDDYLEAFAGHPKIGDVNSLRKKYAHTKALAAGEQASVNEAGEATLVALEKGNNEYEQKFGFIFIVCATGKSAEEMLALLLSRLPNDRDTELRNAAEQQAQITAIRINKLFTPHQPKNVL